MVDGQADGLAPLRRRPRVADRCGVRRGVRRGPRLMLKGVVDTEAGNEALRNGSMLKAIEQMT